MTTITGTTGSDNLTGTSGDDVIDALDGNDTVDAGGGADTVYGGGGGDTLRGGLGNDKLYGDAGNDYLYGGQGSDLLEGGDGDDYLSDSDSGSDTLRGGAGKDNISVSHSTGNNEAIVIDAGADDDQVTFSNYSSGSSIIDLGSGNDQLTLTQNYYSALQITLGDGLDRITLGSSFGGSYYGSATTAFADFAAGAAGDVLNLNGYLTQNLVNWDGSNPFGTSGYLRLTQSGADTLLQLDRDGASASSYTFTTLLTFKNTTTGSFTSENFAGLAPSGAAVPGQTITGTTGSDNLTGTSGDDVIDALDGNDTLNGGEGADRMFGGRGDDTYIVDNRSDSVIEKVGEGIDTVQTALDFALGSDVEKLVLTGSGNVNGTGNALANTITGNGGNNTLDGGAGADTMIGGLGDDTYVVDDAGDIASEAADGGTDTVRASISYTLGVSVERLVLTGTAAINGTGNALVNTLTGNAAANILDGGAGADTMIGGSGDDTYFIDDSGDMVVEVAGEGDDLVYAGFSVTLAANVERLTLTGFDDIDATGNALANTLTGNDGANVLDGGAGADIMIGGQGDDIYVVDSAGDVLTEELDGGFDTVRSAITYTLADNLEDLVLLGSAAIDGTGNAFANTLTGNAAANRLDGGSGADVLIGRGGDDTYVVDDRRDLVIEAAGEGRDLIYASVSFALGANIEQLTLTGTADINATGNGSANVLRGNAGANVLDGGKGADTMYGGDGNDTFYVDTLADVIVEEAGSGPAQTGIDRVIASVSYTLGANVENLTLSGVADLNATGNGSANTLIGNAGSNILNGGAGADTMYGGDGNDTFYVDDRADVIVEYAGTGVAKTGIDTVRTSLASYTLGANLENLVLEGAGNSNGTGNATDNIITGNAGANVLIGAAGNDMLDGAAGADTMYGGDGNDTFYVDNVGDIVVEYAGSGTLQSGVDRVVSSISYMLGGNVENLTLTGTANINATGNAGANTLVGNAGANVLDGGIGADTLTGGDGADTFAFSTPLYSTNIDTITDFIAADDTIQLDDAVFTALRTPGILNAAAFWTGTAAHDADDRIIYNATTGALFYDADGSGAGGAVRFAMLGTGLTLTNADFTIV